jgi:hypothetical protein
MADKTISELPVASAIGATDISVLVSNNVDYQFDFTLLLQFITANLSTGAAITFGTSVPQNTAGKNGDIFIKTDTAAFYQKLNGTWALAYTIPLSTTTGIELLYGLGVPGSAIGADGDSYIDTSTGIFYLRTSGTWAQVFSMQTGPQGPQGTAGTNGINGTNGNTILSGTTNPSNLTDGVSGDYYINLSTYYLFGPKAAGVWPAGISLITSISPDTYNQSFTAVTGLTINWQTDIITGTATYAAFLGNSLSQRPTVYAETTNTDGTFTETAIDYNLTITLSADKSQILTVIFDWGTSQTGTISF